MEELSTLSSYVYLFGNDIRLLHLYAKGKNFMGIHELLNDLYDICFEFYDVFAEMAIAHNEIIPNPTDILLDENIEWYPISGNNFDTESIKKYIVEKGNKIIEIGENLKNYEGFVISEVDDFNGEIDAIINYKFKRIGE